jgi:type II secretory pathway pseudopilin PulG
MKTISQTWIPFRSIYGHTERGFTLIEILLVIGITMTLLLLTLPMSMRFLVMENTEESASTLVSTMHRAQAFAYNGKNNSAWGVKFFADHYVLFSGISYDTRMANFDELHAIDDTVSIAAPSEIMFTALLGAPSMSGEIVVHSGSEEARIAISDIGMIQAE